MDTIQVLDAFNAAFNRHDVDAMMALMTADCVFENTDPPPAGERFAGQAAVRQFWVDFFRAAPRARIDIEDLFACGDRAAQCWVYHWAEDGFVRGVDVFRLRDGKIAEKLSYVKG
ncbi:MAG TPA: nuclear transport factor 2 family protein [Anaerolineaceae bacterium]